MAQLKDLIVNSVIRCIGKIYASEFVGKLTGNSDTATKLETARTVRTNLASTSTASFDGSANITPGVTGTLPIANGGTGKTTAKAAEYNILSGMTEATSDPGDDSLITYTYVTPSETQGKLYWRKASTLWEYIKSKISSVLGLTSTSYGGNAATATKATQDSAGQQINTTYIKSLSASGKTVTYTKGDGTTGTITTQDTNTTYSNATTSAAGLMSASDKSKLDGITESADAVSFSQSLTSGTKVGTITINGTGTDLYCQTNTDTHYTSHLYVGASGGNANATSAIGNPYLLCVDNTTNRNSVQLKAGSNMSISAVDGVVTFTATDTKVQTLTRDPVSATTYYVPFATGAATSTLGINDGFKVNSLQGTADAEGYDRISLGNATATGTDGNKSGGLQMYGTTAYYTLFRPYNQSSSVTKYLVGTSSAAAVGSSTKPVYVSSAGTVTACTYTLEKSVPSDAVFTDTTYSTGTSSTAGLTKLYTSTGTSTDGTMTRNAITTELKNKTAVKIVRWS